MEKVTLYVKKVLALAFSFAALILLVKTGILTTIFLRITGISLSFLIFAYLDYQITGEKPRYLFGLSQSDAFLNKKGGFWNLFKWIVNSLGFVYDLCVWVIWGVYLLFKLFIDLLLFIKFIAYWIIHAIIWFIRQLFPPFIFLFKMFVHYILKWTWWIYQLAVRNVKISINKNFYFIALWGSIPAIFIVFLFYAIGQIVGIPELVAVSAVFAIIPLVWSFGEISALRYDKRCKDDYHDVKYKFGNGFDAVRSVLFYLILMVILIVAEIVFNLLGWIPNLSMSFLGLVLNLNMAISFVLVFLAVIISFSACMMPTHILEHPDHENNLDSSLSFLNVIGRRFLRYSVARIPTAFFGGLLVIIPVLVMALTFQVTDTVKDGVLEARISKLESKENTEKNAVIAYRFGQKIERVESYKDDPLRTSESFANLRGGKAELSNLEKGLVRLQDELLKEDEEYKGEQTLLRQRIVEAENAASDPALISGPSVSELSSQKLMLEQNHLQWVDAQNDAIAIQELDIKEVKRVRTQLPILYFFVGILIAIFGGIVLAVFVAYSGNVNFELYSFRENDESKFSTYWGETIAELREKDGNQPLLGFTFLAILASMAFFLLR